MVTRVDSGQDELSDVRMTEDGGNEEFVDCPDDLVSYDGRSDYCESREAELVLEDQHMFADPKEDNRHSLFDSEKEILPHHYQVGYHLEVAIFFFLRKDSFEPVK